MERIQSRTQGRGNVIFPVVFGTGRFDNWDQIAAMCLMHDYTLSITIHEKLIRKSWACLTGQTMRSLMK